MLCIKSFHSDKWFKSFWLVILGAVAVFYFYISSYGQFKLLGYEVGGATYDILGESLVKFRATTKGGIEPHIGKSGEHVIYYGPLPAFLRIVLNAIYPDGRGQWSRTSNLLAVFFAIYSFLGILRISLNANEGLNYHKKIVMLFSFIGFSLGTPVFFLVSCNVMYHEAIIWGLAGSLFAIQGFLGFIKGFNSYAHATVQVAFGYSIALLSRPTFALPIMGIALILVLYALPIKEPIRLGHRSLQAVLPFRSWLVVSIMGFIPAVTAAIYQLWYNYERWGNVFKFVDYDNYVGFLRSPSAYQRYLDAGGIFNMARFPQAIANYFGISTSNFTSDFPYLSLPAFQYSTKHFMYAEPGLSLLVASPWLVISGVLGILLSLYGDYKHVVVASLLALSSQWVVTGTFNAMSHRYTTDFLPLMIFAFSIFLSWLCSHSSTIVKNVLTILLCTFVLFSVYTTVYSTMQWVAFQSTYVPEQHKVEIRKLFFQKE